MYMDPKMEYRVTYNKKKMNKWKIVYDFLMEGHMWYLAWELLKLVVCD